MSKFRLRSKLSELDAELQDLYSMSEEAACFRYNVNDKQDAINMLCDEIRYTQGELEAEEVRELDPDAERERMMLDPAFATMGDFYRMRAC